MKRVYQLDAETDRARWRQQLLDEVKGGDVVLIDLEKTASFTQTRQLVTTLNTVAWQRGATLGYIDQGEPVPPPLPIRYSRPPSITHQTHSKAVIS